MNTEKRSVTIDDAHGQRKTQIQGDQMVVVDLLVGMGVHKTVSEAIQSALEEYTKRFVPEIEECYGVGLDELQKLSGEQIRHIKLRTRHLRKAKKYFDEVEEAREEFLKKRGNV